jgi:DNA-3-methyladenine glycosylase I
VNLAVVLNRCGWCGDDADYQRYHDHEWAVPVFDDRLLFEMLILEGAQAGLNWLTILRKRENYRQAFDYFDPHKIAAYDEKKIQQLKNNSGIVRHSQKIRSAINNAQCYLILCQQKNSFSDYLWDFVDYKPIQNHWRELKDIPTTTPLSKTLSKDLKQRGFSFVGPTITYAFMQAVGLVNDHLTSCHRHPNHDTIPR